MRIGRQNGDKQLLLSTLVNGGLIVHTSNAWLQTQQIGRQPSCISRRHRALKYRHTGRTESDIQTGELRILCSKPVERSAICRSRPTGSLQITCCWPGKIYSQGRLDLPRTASCTHPLIGHSLLLLKRLELPIAAIGIPLHATTHKTLSTAATNKALRLSIHGLATVQTRCPSTRKTRLARTTTGS